MNSAILPQVIAMMPRGSHEHSAVYKLRLESTTTAVTNQINCLAIAAIAADSPKGTSATERIVKAALREGPTHSLSMLLDTMYKKSGRTLEKQMLKDALASSKSTSELAMMFNMDTRGSHVSEDTIHRLGLALRYDLKDMLLRSQEDGTGQRNLPPELLTFVMEVDHSKALGPSVLDWVSKEKGKEIEIPKNVRDKTPKGMNPFVTGMVLEVQNQLANPSLRGLHHHEIKENEAKIEMANNATFESVNSPQLDMVKAAIDQLKKKDPFSGLTQVRVGANVNTDELDRVGLSPMY